MFSKGNKMSMNDVGFDWPNNKKFAVCLTHDVDRVKKTYQYIYEFLKTRRSYHLRSIFGDKEPYWNFEKIMEIENKYNVKSTFFFLNEKRKFNFSHILKLSLSLGCYSFYEEKIAEIIQKLHNDGWEIGLHGSYDSYTNKDLLKKEKSELEEVLGEEVIGIRQHFLNLKIPRTWEIQHGVGFLYDTSFGFSNIVGFRDQKYSPFRPFNNSFLEIPVSIVDGALFWNYKGKEIIWNNCTNLINEAEKHNGVLTLIWHQRVFNDDEFPGWSRIYEEIIKECVRRDAYFGRSIDIYQRVVEQ